MTRAINIRNNPTWTGLAVVCVPVFLGSLDLTVVSAFLPALLSELGLPLDSEGLSNITWVITSYLLAYSIALFTMGRVSDLIGRRRALVASLVLYLAGSALMVLYALPAVLIGGLYEALGIDAVQSTVNVHAVVLARLIAAFGAGSIPAIAIALVGDLFPQEERAIPLGIVMATDTVGWLMGAAWGGVVIQLMPWQGLFLINMPLVVVALVLMLRALQNLPELPRAGNFDWTGFGLLSGTLTAFVLGLGALTGDGLNVPGAAPFFAVSAMFLIVFWVVESRREHPLIDLSLLRETGASVAMLVNLLVGFCLFIPLVSIPLLVNVQKLFDIGFATIIPPIRTTSLQRASLETGLLMAAFTVPLALSSVAGGWLVNRTGARRTTTVGLVMAVVGFIAVWQFLTLDFPSLATAGLMAITGTGAGLTFTPVIVTTLQAAGENRRGVASAMILGIRMVGMTVATSTLSAFGTQRVIDLIVAIEGGRFIFDSVEQSQYSTVYATTYIQSTVQMLGEMALFGAILCGVALLPALFLRKGDAA